MLFQNVFCRLREWRELLKTVIPIWRLLLTAIFWLTIYMCVFYFGFERPSPYLFLYIHTFEWFWLARHWCKTNDKHMPERDFCFADHPVLDNLRSLYIKSSKGLHNFCFSAFIRVNGQWCKTNDKHMSEQGFLLCWESWLGRSEALQFALELFYLRRLLISKSLMRYR